MSERKSKQNCEPQSQSGGVREPTWDQVVLEEVLPAGGAHILCQGQVADRWAGKGHAADCGCGSLRQLLQQPQHAERGHRSTQRMSCTGTNVAESKDCEGWQGQERNGIELRPNLLHEWEQVDRLLNAALLALTINDHEFQSPGLEWCT